MKLSGVIKNIYQKIKRDSLVIIFLVSFIVFLGVLYSVIKINTTNKTANRITSLNKTLNTYFGSVQGLRKNSGYQQALMDYSDPEETVTKSYSGFYLRDFYIASSSNTINCYKIYNGFINVDMIGTVLDNGARLITLDIFSDSYCSSGKPVVSHHNPSKDYLYNRISTFNYIDFDLCCQKIMERAFSKNDDPLLISLKLHLDKLPAKNKENVVDQLAKIIIKRFKGKLLGSDYSYQRTIIGNVPIEDLFGKIIILCDKGFPGTLLDELVNYSWSEKSTIAKDSKAPFLMLHYTSTELNGVTSQGFELLKIQNKKGITIVDADSGSSEVSLNYNIAFGWEAGCQCVGIDYFNLESVKVYQQKFSGFSFVLKPENLRYIQEYVTYNSYQNPDFSMEPREIESSSSFSGGVQI